MSVLSLDCKGNVWPVFDAHEKPHFEEMQAELNCIARLYSAVTRTGAFTVRPLRPEESHHEQEYAPFFRMLTDVLYSPTLVHLMCPSSNPSKPIEALLTFNTDGTIERLLY